MNIIDCKDEQTKKSYIVKHFEPKLEINTITLQMSLFKNKILDILEEKDKHLVDYILNKLWFNVLYSNIIEEKIKKYLIILKDT